MEDHYGRSEDEEDLCKNGTKVPLLLNEGQKERHVQVCQDILDQFETEPSLLKRAVTGDESWILEFGPLTKWQSLDWKSALSPRTQKTRVFKPKTKIILITFFNVHGIVHAEFLPRDQTINQQVYKNILRRLMCFQECVEAWQRRLEKCI